MIDLLTSSTSDRRTSSCRRRIAALGTAIAVIAICTECGTNSGKTTSDDEVRKVRAFLAEYAASMSTTTNGAYVAQRVHIANAYLDSLNPNTGQSHPFIVSAIVRHALPYRWPKVIELVSMSTSTEAIPIDVLVNGTVLCSVTSVPDATESTMLRMDYLIVYLESTCNKAIAAYGTKWPSWSRINLGAADDLSFVTFTTDRASGERVSSGPYHSEPLVPFVDKAITIADELLGSSNDATMEMRHKRQDFAQDGDSCELVYPVALARAGSRAMFDWIEQGINISEIQMLNSSDQELERIMINWTTDQRLEIEPLLLRQWSVENISADVLNNTKRFRILDRDGQSVGECGNVIDITSD